MSNEEMWNKLAERRNNKLVPERAAMKTATVDGHRFDIVYERFSFLGSALQVAFTDGQQTVQYAICYDGEVVSRETMHVFAEPGKLIVTGGKYHNFLVQEDGVRTHYQVTMIGSPEAPGFEIKRNQKEIVATIPVGH